MTFKRKDEPLTPIGGIFVQPKTENVVHCLIGGKDPINVEAVKSVIRDCKMIKHHRFSSLLVTDSHGREHWEKTTIDLDRHIIVVQEPVGHSSVIGDEEAANEYLADLAVSSPLSTDKPLWEVHLLMAHNCAVLRMHHALGDGVSLMSMLSRCCKADDRNHLRKPKSNSRRNASVWEIMKGLYLVFVYMTEYLWRIMWAKDKTTVISGGAGTDLWPRKLATAKFALDDMMTVKNAIPHATVNDVLSGVISSGLTRYLDIRSPNAYKEGLQITGTAMANLRPQLDSQGMSKSMESDSTVAWVNKFAINLYPVYYHKNGNDYLSYVKEAKEINDKKKQSRESYFLYKIFCFLVFIMGPKLVSMLLYRILCGTTFMISNMVGPREQIMIAGNPVKFIRVTSTSLPHAITMHAVSYAGNVEMQILVAKDIVPDPHVLAKCFEDALFQMMKEAAIPKLMKIEVGSDKFASLEVEDINICTS